MKKTKDIKMYYFFDEAGDTTILGRKGVNLLADGKVSKVFIVAISLQNVKYSTKIHNFPLYSIPYPQKCKDANIF